MWLGEGEWRGGGTIFFMDFRREVSPVLLVSYPLAVDLYTQSAARTKLLLNIQTALIPNFGATKDPRPNETECFVVNERDTSHVFNLE